MRPVIFCSFGFLLLLSRLDAQPLSNAQFTHYTVKEGLPHNAIGKTIRDKKGFLWIGTDFGVARFDGKTFKNYKHIYGDSCSLRGNMLFKFALDQYGRLWLGGLGGLMYFDEKRDCFVPVGLKTDIHDIVTDAQNQLWITDSKNVYQVDAAMLRLTPVDFGNKISVLRLHFDKKNRLWMTGYSNGCYRFDVATQTLQFYDTRSFYVSIFEDSAGQMWFGAKIGGFELFDESKNRFLTFTEIVKNLDQYAHLQKLDCSNITTHPTLTGNTTLWIATKGKGLILFDTEKRVITHNFDTKNGFYDEIENIYVDADGIIWLSSFKGLIKANTRSMPFRPLTFPFIKQWVLGVSHIVPDKNTPSVWWVTTMGDGVYRYDSENQKALQHIPLKGKEWYSKYEGWAYTMVYDAAGNLWIGYDAGLLRVSPNGGKQQYFIKDEKDQKQPVFQILLRGGDSMILNLGKSVCVYEYEKNKRRFFRFDDIREEVDAEWIRQLVIDKQDILWATSSWGLKRIDFNKNIKNTFLQKKDGNRSLDNLSDLVLDEKGQVWFVGTDGLGVFNPTDVSFINYDEKYGLDKGQVKYLFYDKRKQLWVYSVNGLYRFDSLKKRFDQFPIPNTMVHIMQHQTPICRSEVGDEVFITLFGNYFAFNPLTISQTTPPPSPFITDFKVFYNRYSFDADSVSKQPIVLNHFQNSVSFNFTALNFDNNALIQFDYILEGLDTTYSRATNQNSVNFTNLASGDYTFKVFTVNSMNIKSLQPAVFKFTIRTPFWKTTWFLVLSAVAFVGFVFGIFRIREIQRIRTEQMRLRIAQDLHDEMGSELSSISILSSVAAGQVADNSFAADMMQSVGEKTRAVSNIMRDIVWSIDPANDKIERVTQKMREYAAQTIEQQNIELSLKIDPTTEGYQLPMSKRKDLLLLFKEAITNITRHANARKVWIDIQIKGQFFELKIQDDGNGFDTQTESSGNGLRSMHQRAKNLNGQLSVIAQSQQGTSLILRFPVA